MLGQGLEFRAYGLGFDGDENAQAKAATSFQTPIHNSLRPSELSKASGYVWFGVEEIY